MTNPKDIVTQGLGSIPDLQIDLAATMLDTMLGIWTNGSVSDAPVAYSTGVFTLMQAVDSMAQVKALAAKEEAEEKEDRMKSVILLILSVFLIFVPVVGEEFATAAGLATLARAITIAGELGNAALDLYNTVQDPTQAFVSVLGLLFGVGSIVKAARDGEGIGDIARIKRGMSSDAAATLGKIFEDNDDKLTTLSKFCKAS